MKKGMPPITLDTRQLFQYKHYYFNPQEPIESIESIQKKVESYYYALSQAKHFHSNLAYYALRNSTDTDKIINHYLIHLFAKGGISLDDELKKKLMIALVRADIDARITNHGKDLDLETAYQLHVDIFKTYAGFNREIFHDSVFRMRFSYALWTGADPLLNGLGLLPGRYTQGDEYPLQPSSGGLSEYMQFIEAVFYTDKLLQAAILHLPNQSKHKFFSTIESDVQGNQWLRNEFKGLIELYGYSPMLREVSENCIYMANDKMLHTIEGKFCTIIKGWKSMSSNQYNGNHGLVIQKREQPELSDVSFYSTLNTGKNPIPTKISDADVLLYSTFNEGNEPTPTSISELSDVSFYSDLNTGLNPIPVLPSTSLSSAAFFHGSKKTEALPLPAATSGLNHFCAAPVASGFTVPTSTIAP